MLTHVQKITLDDILSISFVSGYFSTHDKRPNFKKTSFKFQLRFISTTEKFLGNRRLVTFTIACDSVSVYFIFVLLCNKKEFNSPSKENTIKTTTRLCFN